MDSDLAELVQRARDGEASAWEELVPRFRGLVAAISRSFSLTGADAEDVAQTTWLRLYESIGSIRQPERLAAWIGTTARRECLRLLRTAARELPAESLEGTEDSHSFAAPDQVVLATEELATVRAAVHALPDRHRRLIGVLASAPTPSYSAVAESLDMPIGSIGPTRGRAIDRLRRAPEILALAS